jgi:hypothetical protein
VLLGLTLLLSVLTTPGHAAQRRPDLVMSSVKAGPGSVERGDRITVRDTTANSGRARAGRTTTRFYLSTDRRFGRSDRLLGSRGVPALAPGKKSSGRTQLRVPAATPLRGWYVVACADVRKKVRESREGNNCRATSSKVTVVAPPPPPPSTPTFPMTPDPLDVDSTLQTERAVSQFVNPHEVTEIAAVAADGTSYTLTVPAGALLGPTTITMTPVASVPGLPLSGGLAAGVQIEPHGLMLLQPASLEITSPDLGPINQQTAFLFHEGGSDFHLYPMAMPEAGDDADTVRMSLTHFSTPGLGLGSLTDRNNVAAQVPGRLQSQVEGLISEASREAREAGEGGPPPDGDWAHEVISVENAYFDQVVRPHLADAEGTPSLAPKAIAEAIAWSRALQLLGDTENPRHQEVLERMVRLFEILMHHHWNRCTQQSDLDSITELLRIVRYSQLMTLPFAEEADDKLHRCANFEVRFTSSVTHSSSWSGTLQSGSTQGQWDLASTFEVPFLSFTAAGPLEYTNFHLNTTNTIHGDPSCTSVTVGTSTTPGLLRASVAPMIELNPKEDEEPPRVRVNVAVNVDGNQRPKEGYRYTPCNGPDSVWQDSRWASYFGSLHPTRSFASDPARQSGRSIDTKTWSGQDQDGSTSGVATVELWHKPLT